MVSRTFFQTRLLTTGTIVNRLRTLLILGRVSNLPTIWSNCLAGWILGHGAIETSLLQLCLSASLLYIGGMFLNDFCDVKFDQIHRQERPIPSHQISRTTVLGWSIFCLASGLLTLIPFGRSTFLFGIFLTALITLYDLIHKKTAFGLCIIAACRFTLYLTAASAVSPLFSTQLLFAATTLALYTLGLSYLARSENLPRLIRFWPSLFLFTPLLMTFFLRDHLIIALGYSSLLCLWILFCMRFLFWTQSPKPQIAIAGLLAGIILVDCLVIAPLFPVIGIVLLPLFGLCLLMQKIIPAT
jgi:hypothetical protein